MWKLHLVTLLLALLQFSAHATGDSTRYLAPKDTIFLNIDATGEKLFEHKIERKQTLFSLSKFYGLSVEELYYYNAGLKEESVSPGDKVLIPIPNRAIIRYKVQGFKAWKHVPVFYIVKKGDTMFRVAKTIFKMPVDSILQRNRLQSETVKVGQRLHIGWMSMDGIPEDFRKEVGNPLTRKNTALRKVYTREQGDRKIKEHQGVAYWQKNSKEDSDLYALHREAHRNSIIAVTNPMNKSVIYVKVIGKIPDTAYGSEVVVILSPLAAKALGAKDPRFFVKVKYY
jgi:LysM repeat protein